MTGQAELLWLILSRLGWIEGQHTGTLECRSTYLTITRPGISINPERGRLPTQGPSNFQLFIKIEAPLSHYTRHVNGETAANAHKLPEKVSSIGLGQKRWVFPEQRSIYSDASIRGLQGVWNDECIIKIQVWSANIRRRWTFVFRIRAGSLQGTLLAQTRGDGACLLLFPEFDSLLLVKLFVAWAAWRWMGQVCTEPSLVRWIINCG